jgi:hypothetical protein
VTAMRPAPKPSDVQEAEEPVLDEVIQRIDASLPIIHQKAASGGSEETPTGRLSKAQFARARATFQDMRDDPLLNEEGDDICLKKKKKRRKVNSKVNGSHGPLP